MFVSHILEVPGEHTPPRPQKSTSSLPGHNQEEMLDLLEISTLDNNMQTPLWNSHKETSWRKKMKTSKRNV